MDPTDPTAGTSGSTGGTACGGDAAQVYEVFGQNPFDLAANDIVFTAGVGQTTQSSAPGTAIVPPVAADLGLGDEENSSLLPIGFTCDLGTVSFDAVSIASNGYVWLGGTGRADYSDTELEFVTEGPRVLPAHDDADLAGRPGAVEVGGGLDLHPG